MQISIGGSRTTKTWQNVVISWEDFIARCRNSISREITREEFDNLPREKQDDYKDVGGFVGGICQDGKRTSGGVTHRSMITLDLDHCKDDTLVRIEDAVKKLDCCAVVYSTFKSLKENKRLRLCIPLSENITSDKYAAAAESVASMIDIDAVDKASFKPNQFMYWPARPSDVEPEFYEFRGGVLDITKVAKSEKELPDDEKMLENDEVRAGVQEDPLIKPYPVGTFCRSYSIHEAIETFLPGIYESVSDNRYHLVGADASAGATVYDDRFLFSHHAHDIAHNKLCNAFDLVRLHLYGDGSDSFDRMVSETVNADEKCNALRCKEDFEASDFAQRSEGIKPQCLNPVDVIAKLEKGKSGAPLTNLKNLKVILELDENLQNITYDEFAQDYRVTGPLPWNREGKLWKESDLSNLCAYLADVYGYNSTSNVQTILLAVVTDSRSHHPVRDYFSSLKWDGQARLDELFIRYLGAPDTELTRALTRKLFVAAVRRVKEPGTKFDFVIVLKGPQGVGKSTIIDRLGGEWYSDSLTITDMKDKTAAEKLQGNLLLEISELTGMSSASNETLKSFITRRNDKFRPAYGRVTEERPRQCVFIGTTNDDAFLRDETGNRRFGIIQTAQGIAPEKWDEMGFDRDKLWAEAVHYEAAGEDLFLSKELAIEAEKIQRDNIAGSEREGVIWDYLSRLIPAEWDSMNEMQRIDFIDGRELASCKHEGTETRKHVCILEICYTALRMPHDRAISKSDVAMIARTLTKLGWVNEKRKRRHKLYGPCATYIPTDAFYELNDKLDREESERKNSENVIDFMM